MTCKCGYDHEAEGQEWALGPTLTPNPRTNKKDEYHKCTFLVK